MPTRLTAAQHREHDEKRAVAATLERRQQQEAKSRIMELLALNHPDLAYNNLHTYPLYGTRGSLSIGQAHHYSSLGETEDRASWEELCALVSRFPPSPIVLHRDGCVGVRPESYHDNRDSPNAVIAPLSFLTLRIQSGDYCGYRSCLAEWFTDLAEDCRISLDVLLLPAEVPAEMRVEYDRYQNGEIREVRNVSLYYPPEFKICEKIKYAGGTNKDPGNYLLYWWKAASAGISAAEFLRSIWTPPKAKE